MNDISKDTTASGAKKGQEDYQLYSVTRLGKYIRLKRERMVFDFVTRNIRAGATILEIGAGRGEFAEQARSNGYEYIGVEPSASMRSVWVARGFRVLERPVPEIDLADEEVDLVYSSAVIEHLENYPTVLKFFKEARRVLREGGIISSIVPNCDSIGMIFYLQDYQHNFVTNQGRLHHLARDCGFEIIESRCYLTNLGLSRFAFVDRILAHTVLLFMRSPLIYAVVHFCFGEEITTRIYKNLFDLTIVMARKC